VYSAKELPQGWLHRLDNQIAIYVSCQRVYEVAMAEPGKVVPINVKSGDFKAWKSYWEEVSK
jgi:hypothetical protein